MLQTIVEDLNTPQSAQEQKEKSYGHGPRQGLGPCVESGAELHASVRLQGGFTIEDLVSEFRALRASVLRLWEKSSGAVQQSDLDDITRFNEAIDQAVAESVARFSASSTGDPDSAGIGLGLYVTREIITAHGGAVTLASSLEDGTTFAVRLPRRCESG